MNARHSLAVLLLCVLLPACASIMTGKHDIITVNSSPTGAKFTTNTGVQGVTPAIVEVPDSVDVQFTFEMDGYAPAGYSANHYISKWVWGNILIGGVIGLIVDFASGGMGTHDDSIYVTLAQALQQPALQQPAVEQPPVPIPQP
ncbi:MAG: hypothetical protein FJ296_10740 [Planctomycetes bacterium]|nr:hypothetical protein [Planctomycetota bacterium]